MKILNKHHNNYFLFYNIEHNDDIKVYVRNMFHVYTPLCSHKRNGETALLYNSMSGEIVILNNEEDKWWKETDHELNTDTITDAAHRDFVLKLIGHEFLVPLNTDIVNVLDNGRAAALDTFYRNCNLSEGYTTYVIFTTMECNARCFYCYEKGLSHIRMREDTALDTARLIEKNYHINKQKVIIEWFGGEPLYNIQVIDKIADYLNENKVPFISNMISNAYLFTPDVQQRAIDSWHIKHVQITLDGREDIYNKTKNFIYPHNQGISPYQRVIDNILSASDKGIKVSIRINIDLHNANELMLLTDELAERIGKKQSNITIYSHTLFDNAKHIEGKDREMHIAQAQMRLTYHLHELGLSPKPKAIEEVINRCSSDNPKNININADGSCCKCEHLFLKKDAFTDIHGSFFDSNKYDMYFEKYPRHESCQDCSIMPLCIRLKVCQSSDHCKRYEKWTEIANIKAKILKLYNEYTLSDKTLKEADVHLHNPIKIKDLTSIEAPAHIWAVSHSKYAATLPAGTWSAQFVFSFEMGNHNIQKLIIERLDHTSKTSRSLSSDTRHDLHTSLSNICNAYLTEHADDVLIMRQTAAQQRLTGLWFKEFNTRCPETISMIQLNTKDKDGNIVYISIFVSRKCSNYTAVCEALTEQAYLFA